MTKQYFSKMWRKHEPVLQTINYCNIEYSINNQPIFVLDEDPKRCALSLSLEHIKKYIEYITYSTIIFRCTDTVIKKSGAENQPRVDYMYYNQRTAYWFYCLYNEMQRIYKERFGKFYKVSDFMQEIWINNMQGISGPKDIKFRQYKGIRLLSPKCVELKFKEIYEPYQKMLDSINSRINKFRTMYMILGYLNNEFPNGAPAWYNCMRTTIWKSYNKMTRLFYRIDTSIEGIYTYYYSADNKNWIEIENVPLDMRHMIDGMIFARDIVNM